MKNSGVSYKNSEVSHCCDVIFMTSEVWSLIEDITTSEVWGLIEDITVLFVFILVRYLF